MEEENKKTSNVALKIVCIVVIAVVVAVVAGVGVYFGAQAISINSLKGETITAENYEELVTKLGEKLEGKDDLYYLFYAMTCHMADGLASTFSNSGDQNAMFANIYGKTVQQLIDEGKQLMEDNNVTVEQVKQQIENVSNIVVQ